MTEGQRPLPSKKDVAMTLLESPSLFIHLDPRRDGVVVPKWLVQRHELVLQVGLNMAIPIPDLRVDDAGVTCTLSFNRAPFRCVLPWSAVYALVGEDGRAMIWPDDVPPEVVAQLPARGVKAEKPPPRRKPRTTAAEGERPSTAARREGGARDRTAAAEERRRPPPPRVPVPAAAALVPPPAGPGPGAGNGSTPSAPGLRSGPRKPRRELPPYLRVVK